MFGRTRLSLDDQVPGTPVMTSEQKYLDFYLAQWEERMSKVETLDMKIILTGRTAGQNRLRAGSHEARYARCC